MNKHESQPIDPELEWEWECDSCHRSDVPSAPMLFDDVWAKLADERETLCPNCMFERAIERKVYLELSSLKPCPVNLFHWPRSDYNLFVQGEPQPTQMSPEWRDVWNELHTTECMVGDQVRRVARGLFLDVAWQLDEHYRAEGLRGHALDCAIEEALPQRLAQVLDGTAADEAPPGINNKTKA